MHTQLIQDFLDKCVNRDGQIVYRNQFSTMSMSLDYQPTANRQRYPDNIDAWSQISTQARHIERDVDLLDSIVHRIMYFYSNGDELQLDPRLLNRYVTTDLEAFHVIYRSLYDHIALINIVLADNPGQFDIDSFRKQRNRVLTNDGFRRRIGDQLFELITLADWFDHVRSVRDSVVHHGGIITYDFTDDFLLVEVQRHLRNEVILPDLIFFDDRRIKFEWYAALNMVYLHSYLELIDQLAINRLNFVRTANNTGREHPILNSYHEWIAQLTED